jgi:hypothetical protein
MLSDRYQYSCQDLNIVFYLKHVFSETGFCLRLQVEYTQLGPIEGDSLSPETELSSIY